MNLNRRNLVRGVFLCFVLFISYIEYDKYAYSKIESKAIFEITNGLNFTGLILIPLKTPQKTQSLDEFRSLCKENFKLYYYISMDEYHIFATNSTITDNIKTTKGNAYLLDPLEQLYQFTFKIVRTSVFPFPKYEWFPSCQKSETR